VRHRITKVAASACYARSGVHGAAVYVERSRTRPLMLVARAYLAGTCRNQEALAVSSPLYAARLMWPSLNRRRAGNL
jgi:hypothetical protein